MSFGSPRMIVLVIALAAGVYLVGNGRVSLWDRDEPRYAQTSRQMLQSGDWVVPKFLDKVRTAKPVFIYWCQASAMAVLGDEGARGVFAARLPSVVGMVAVLVLAAVVVTRGVGREHAFWTVLVLASCALTVWSAKACTTDAVLLVGVTLAQVCVYRVWRGDATWPVVMLLAVAVTQGILTKGPVVLGVIGTTVLGMGVFRLLDRRRETRGFPVSPSPGTPGEGWGEGLVHAKDEDPHPNPLPEYREREKSVIPRILVAVVIVVALVAPWIYLVHQREKAFLGTSVAHDVVRRTLGPLEGHKGPPGYHLALIFATFFPWSLLLPMAIVSAWKNRADPQIRFALAAVLGPWVMFEIVQTKLPHYMLPAFPPLAFLTADAIVRQLRGDGDDLHGTPFRIAAGAVAVVAIGLGLVPVYVAHRFGDPIPPAVAVACAAGAMALVFFANVLVFRARAALVWMGLGSFFVCGVLFETYVPRADALRVSIRVAAILRHEGATGPPGSVVMLDYKEPSLAFYQGGTIRENSAMSLSHELLDAGPTWFVITDEVWSKTPPDVQKRLELAGSVSGFAYADGGRTVNVRVVRKQ